MAWTPDPDALRGRVAVVAGATRGAGRGIAGALGEAGATVVCTGRTTSSTTDAGSVRSDYDRPETIEETAALVTELGGTGVAVPVDHLDTDQVAALARRIRADHGHIDVLVNDIWAASCSPAGLRDGTRRSGSSTSSRASACSGSPSTPTSSRRTTCSRC